MSYQEGKYRQVKQLLDLRQQSGKAQILVDYLGVWDEKPLGMALNKLVEYVPVLKHEYLENLE